VADRVELSARAREASEFNIPRMSLMRISTSARMFRSFVCGESGCGSSSFPVMSLISRSRSTRAALSNRGQSRCALVHKLPLQSVDDEPQTRRLLRSVWGPDHGDREAARSHQPIAQENRGRSRPPKYIMTEPWVGCRFHARLPVPEQRNRALIAESWPRRGWGSFRRAARKPARSTAAPPVAPNRLTMPRR
jgi:hypothetical protein